MPGRVAEDRHDHGEPDEERQRPEHQQTATIKPQIAIVTGFAATARTEVISAAAAPTSRSSSSGKDTTLMVKATTAKTKPIALPKTMSFHPAGVVNTAFTKVAIESGAAYTPNSDW